MENIRQDWSKFLEYSVEFIKEPLIFFDIGCSGGADKILENFGEKINYYGFDPNVQDIKKQSENNILKSFNYIEGFVKLEDCGVKNKNITNSFSETCAVDIAKKKSAKNKDDYDDMFGNNIWKNVELSKNKIDLSEFVRENKIEDLDFLKTDLDSLDYSFFNSYKKFISESNILGIVAEVSFADRKNDEADLTSLLREYSFLLNDLTIRKYSLKYLPDFFSLDMAAQSVSGRAFCGDALYFKDYSFCEKYSSQKLLKFVILMDLFNLPDCAARILCLYGDKLKETGIDITEALNLLADQRFYGSQGYVELVEKYEKDLELFYPKNISEQKVLEFLGNKIFMIGNGMFDKICHKMINNFNQIDNQSNEDNIENVDSKKTKDSALSNFFRKIANFN